MSTESVVRKAVPADLKAIWELMNLAYGEVGMFHRCDAKVDWILDRVLNPERIPPEDLGFRGYMGVIGPVGGPLEGFILLSIGCYWYSDQYHLEEYINFVHPEHRRSDHAVTLLGYAKNLAEQIGIPLVIGVLSNKRTESKVRLYRKKLPLAGAFFVHNYPGVEEVTGWLSDLPRSQKSKERRNLKRSVAYEMRHGR